MKLFLKVLLVMTFMLWILFSYGQVKEEQIGKVIFISYPFNKKASKKKRKIIQKVNKIINMEASKDFPIVILDLNLIGVRNLRNNTTYDNIEIVYQEYGKEFFSDAYQYDGKHLYLSLSLNKKHREYTIKLIRYAIKNLDKLKEKELQLRSKKEEGTLTDSDIDSFELKKEDLDDI